MTQEKMSRTYFHSDASAGLPAEVKTLAHAGWRILKQEYSSQPSNGLTITYVRDTSSKAVATNPVPARLHARVQKKLTLHTYRLPEALGVVGGLGVGLALTPFFHPAALLILLSTLFAIWLDWRGVLTLRGRWRWLPLLAQGDALLPAFLWVVGLPVLMLAYGAEVVVTFRREHNRQRLHAIANLEAQLGITPPIVGLCRDCRRPVQLDATFCAFCGEPVRPVKQLAPVCPHCATIALPGAQFCPNCREPLQAQEHHL